jgi:hypothetical protein
MDLGSGIRDPEKTHSGSRIQVTKRHRIRIRNTELLDEKTTTITARIFS